MTGVHHFDAPLRLAIAAADSENRGTGSGPRPGPDFNLKSPNRSPP